MPLVTIKQCMSGMLINTSITQLLNYCGCLGCTVHTIYYTYVHILWVTFYYIISTGVKLFMIEFNVTFVPQAMAPYGVFHTMHIRTVRNIIIYMHCTHVYN